MADLIRNSPAISMAPFLAKAGHSLQVPGKSGILADHDKRRRLIFQCDCILPNFRKLEILNPTFQHLSQDGVKQTLTPKPLRI
ncbi:MAG TPA: hypothetical protein VN944_09770 [Nitrospiria bacterium]|nr:hypothetical protein [Nitrospiria bacterium]